MFDIKEFHDYKEAFTEGYNYAVSCQDRDNVVRPDKDTLDYSNMVEIGYSDGVDYGVYCMDTFQTNYIKPENFVAVVDKFHTQAMNRKAEYLEAKKMSKVK